MGFNIYDFSTLTHNIHVGLAESFSPGFGDDN